MSRKASIAFAAAAALAAGACSSDDANDQQELQALLHDGPLNQLSAGAIGAATGEVSAPSTDSHASFIPPTASPIGAWDFDDCMAFRTDLSDVSGNHHTAYRSVGVACAAGVDNLGVAIAHREDIVYVPDQPSFWFDDGVTIAGWFSPTTTDGTRTLFRKRDKGTSSFALVLHRGRFQFVVSLGDHLALSVTAPTRARAGVFQHVAGTYDGATLRLYIDGAEVAHVTSAGTIPLGPGPLLIGNDGSERRFDGVIDSTLFATHALTADEVLGLTCILRPPTITVGPPFLDVPPGVPATIDVSFTSNNSAACPPTIFVVTDYAESNDFAPPLGLDPPEFTPTPAAPVPSGGTVHFTISATPSATIDPAELIMFVIHVSVMDETHGGFFEFEPIFLTVVEPPGCHVSTPHELMITAIRVVDDPTRTVFTPGSTDPGNGAWSFKHLMEDMAPTPADAPAMVEAMLRSFLTPQIINGFTVEARPGMQSRVLDVWPRTPDGALDLAQAPVRLQAIVNRIDLRDLASGDAGELRFVFAFYESFFAPWQATLSFDYKVPAATPDDVVAWARSFHAAGGLWRNADYNAALQVITDRVVGRNTRPGSPNGSALGAVRSNEAAFGGDDRWQMREFRLSPTTGLLEPAPLTQTPDRSFNNTTTLASFITANEPAILADQHTIPRVFDGQPFQAGAVINDRDTWFAPGIDPEARRHLALDTCNGCHSSAETRTPFTHITPRWVYDQASLSGFLTGITISDPVTGELRIYNELARRNADLTAIVCADPAALAGTASTR